MLFEEKKRDHNEFYDIWYELSYWFSGMQLKQVYAIFECRWHTGFEHFEQKKRVFRRL